MAPKVSPKMSPKMSPNLSPNLAFRGFYITTGNAALEGIVLPDFFDAG